MSNEESFSSASQDGTKANSVVVKIALIGDAAIGKTSLMVKYVEDKYDEDYIQTLGVNFMEKKVKIRDASVTFSIWDLGGQREFVNMLPLVCNEAAAILFMFDLSRKVTLASVKEWYRQARGLNKAAVPFMIGTKFDSFQELSEEEQEDITKQARKYAKLMRAPLLYCSAKDGVNIPKIFKVVLAKCFDLNCNLPTVSALGQPIFEY